MVNRPSEAWWKQPDVSPWVPELIRVRSVGLLGIGNMRPAELPLLRAKAREHYPATRLDTVALRSLLQDVAELLPEEYQLPARYEFGLIPVPDVEQQTSAIRREAAAAAMFVSFSAFRHDEARERALLEMAASLLNQLRPTDPPSEPSDYKTEYIRRERVHDALASAVNSTKGSTAEQWERRGLVIVRGEPGSGASRSVYEHFRGKDMVRLPASSEAALLAAICALLERQRLSVGVEAAAIRHQFAKLLSSTDGPQTIILDDAESLNALLAWLPERLRTLVVVVTRQVTPAHTAPVVEVAEIEDDDELIEFVQQQCKVVQDARLARRIGVLLGRRVGAIASLKRLLDELQMDAPDDLVTMLEADIVPAIEAATKTGVEPLTAVYRRLIDSLADESNSLDLLALMAFSTHQEMTGRALATLRCEDGVEAAVSPEGQISFLAGVRPLVALGLVRRDGTRYTMDPFTARLVRRYLAERFRGTFLTAVLSLRDEHADIRTWIDLSELGWSAADIASYVASIQLMLARADPASLTESYQGTGLRSDPQSEVIAMQMGEVLWELVYFLVRQVLTLRVGSTSFADVIGALPRASLGQLIRVWRTTGASETPALLAPLNDALKEVLGLASAPVSDAELDNWIVQHRLLKPHSKHHRDQMRHAYAAFRSAMVGGALGHELELDGGEPAWAKEFPSPPDFANDEEAARWWAKWSMDLSREMNDDLKKRSGRPRRRK